MEKGRLIQLTNSPYGHTIHHNRVFSKADQWIVYDGRNEDDKIKENSMIGVVNVLNKEEKIVYRVKNPTAFGPGVGAASFAPRNDRIIFIHGPENASNGNPYSLNRRTGVAIDLDSPFIPIHMDARDITLPFIPGSLRGGTHSHCWSNDGRMISFTYNDEFVDPDLRTIGVMFDSGKSVEVDIYPGNNSGIMYSSILVNVIRSPLYGSDEIDKAFDEGWIGENGYINSFGERIEYALAFQGRTLNNKGIPIVEIYVVNIDKDLIIHNNKTGGNMSEGPLVPKGIKSRRISRTNNGLSSVRHWLRSSKDGKYIYALADDWQGIAQLISCEINSGDIKYLTNNPFKIDFPFNVDYNNNRIAYVANNNIYSLDIETLQNVQLTSFKKTDFKITSAPNFSSSGHLLIFTQKIYIQNSYYNQIMCLNLN